MSGHEGDAGDVAVLLAGIREALHAQNRALAIMLNTQKLQGEMLAKVLEAVTKEGDSSLSELLGALVAADKHHAAMLGRVLNGLRALGATPA